jgi:phosphate:Na+ symporter
MLPFMTLQVAFLEKFITEKIPEVDQPKYLSGVSAAFPGTAVEAVRLETLRVYESALRISIDGLHMKMAEVLSNIDLEQVVAVQQRLHQFDIDAMKEAQLEEKMLMEQGRQKRKRLSKELEIVKAQYVKGLKPLQSLETS